MNEMAKHVTDLNTLAGEINSIKGQTRQMIMSASIEIGRRLTDAKVLCPHGQWSNWLKSKVDYSQRTAQNLMRMFEEYGNGQINLFGKAKTQALADLGYTQAVALLSLPAEEREEFIEDNDIDKLTTRQLQEAIKEKKEKEAELTKTKAALEASNKLVDRLSTQITQVEQSVDDTDNTEIVQELKDSLDKEKAKVKKLTEELDKPSKPKIVEVVPKEITDELDMLRAKLVNDDSPLMAKFRFQFMGLQRDFKELKATLSEIADMDREVGKKLSGAIVALANGIIKDTTSSREDIDAN